MQSLNGLPWLPAPPADFRERCRDLKDDDPDLGPKIQQLASYGLDATQATALTRVIRRAQAAQARLSPLSDFRLGLLAPWTADLLGDAIPTAAARHGVNLHIKCAPYGQIVQEALDPNSVINTSGLDACLLLLDHRALHLERPCPPDQAQPIVTAALQQVREIVEALKRLGGSSTIVQTIPTPAHALFGSFDRRLPGTPRWLCDEFNSHISALAQETGSYLLDTAALAERVGTNNWFDSVQWHQYKLPFAAEFNELFADTIGRLLGAIRGKVRKCLVLDLDNTLWGGVIGDDGIDGILLGQGNGRGEAHLAVQQLALDLHARGVILAVSSKNEEETARAAFRDHPEMILKEGHIAIFQANWLDKASNLRAIADELGIGLDALVMLDDNPAERAHLRAALPMVAAPELPSDPSLFPAAVSNAGYFEAVSYSEEDRLRAESYASQARRAEVIAASREVKDYLNALGMVVSFSPFRETTRPRLAQLINKTNQFNLTTRRYTEAQVAAFERDESIYTLQVRLRDLFGDFGLIGVVVAVAGPEARTWEIDTWLMSCRVLGRRVEEAMFQELLKGARAAGIAKLYGLYRRTPKNSVVAEHYDKLGFVSLGQDSGSTRYVFNLCEGVTAPLPFEVERNSMVARENLEVA